MMQVLQDERERELPGRKVVEQDTKNNDERRKVLHNNIKKYKDFYETLTHAPIDTN